LLRQLVMRWCGDPAGTLQNDLIGGEGGLVSAEPAVRLRRLAQLAAADPALLDRLTRGTLDQILSKLHSTRAFAEEYQGYVAKFGDRTVNELKLESFTLHDDPLPLFRAVGALAQQAITASGVDSAAAASSDRLREDARGRIAKALGRRPLRRIIFSWVL